MAVLLFLLFAAPVQAHDCPPVPRCEGTACLQDDTCARESTARSHVPAARDESATAAQVDQGAQEPWDQFLTALARSAGAMEISIPLVALGLAGGQAGLLALAIVSGLAVAGFYLGIMAIQSGLIVDAVLIGPACLLAAGILLVIPRAHLRLPVSITALPAAMACGLMFELYFAPFDLPPAAGLGMAAVPAAAMLIGSGLSALAQKPWFIIAQRILGSWIIAGAVMLFALVLGPGWFENL